MLSSSEWFLKEGNQTANSQTFLQDEEGRKKYHLLDFSPQMSSMDVIQLDNKEVIRSLKDLPASKIDWMTDQLLKDPLLSDVPKEKIDELSPHDIQVQQNYWSVTDVGTEVNIHGQRRGNYCSSEETYRRDISYLLSLALQLLQIHSLLLF